jgi:hypothetical protein
VRPAARAAGAEGEAYPRWATVRHLQWGAGLAFQIDLVFFGSKIHRAKKHEIMERETDARAAIRALKPGS